MTRIFDYIAKIEKDSQALFSMIVRVNLKRSWNRAWQSFSIQIFIIIIRIIVLIYPENIVFNLGNQYYPNFINKVRFLSYLNGMAY